MSVQGRGTALPGSAFLHCILGTSLALALLLSLSNGPIRKLYQERALYHKKANTALLNFMIPTELPLEFEIRFCKGKSWGLGQGFKI